MILIIHRGSHQIGGSCVEVKTKNCRILIDIGLPLDFDDKSSPNIQENIGQMVDDGIAPDVAGLYGKGETSIDALFISHAHIDHYGIIPHIDQNIPIYMNKGTEKLIEATYKFRKIDWEINERHTFSSGDSVTVGDLTITPILVDHSAFDAHAFIIEGEGKRIFYSGDFRGHGRKGSLFKKIIDNPPADIDCLILEGTQIEGGKRSYRTEKDVEKRLVEMMTPQDYPLFLACSSQNIDRIVSVYKACVRSGRVFVIDPYTAFILRSVKEISSKIPQHDWGEVIKVFFLKHPYTEILAEDKILFSFKKAKISEDDILENSRKVVLKDSVKMREKFAPKLNGPKLIYSMWPGYFDDNLETFWKRHGASIEFVHTSGHAYMKDLKKLVEKMNPSMIVPIHTFHPDKFRNHFGDSVRIARDGDAIGI